MTEPIQYEKIEDHIIRIFKEQRTNPDLLVTEYLENELAALDLSDKTKALDKLIELFGPQDYGNKKTDVLPEDDHVLARVIKLLLGREISQVDLSSEELL